MVQCQARSTIPPEASAPPVPEPFHNALLQIKIMDHQLRRFSGTKEYSIPQRLRMYCSAISTPVAMGVNRLWRLWRKAWQTALSENITVSCHQIRMQQTILQTKQAVTSVRQASTRSQSLLLSSLSREKPPYIPPPGAQAVSAASCEESCGSCSRP